MIELLTLKFFLGFLLGLISITGLICNILVIVPVYRLAFVFNKSPIYLISLVNIFADILNLSVTVFIFVPTILADSFIFTDKNEGRLQIFFGILFMFCWYLGSITQIIMAINRVVVICFHGREYFTKRVLLTVFSVIFPLIIVMTYMAQIGLPCCALIYDHTILSIRYIGTVTDINYSNMFIDVPLNFGCSMTAFTCYSMIVFTVRKTRKATRHTAQTEQKRRSREYAYATQFCLISVFYTISWLLFRIFPIILENQRVEYYCLVMFGVSLNNSANAIVYICFNKEVQKYIKRSRYFIFPSAECDTETDNRFGNRVVSTVSVAFTTSRQIEKF